VRAMSISYEKEDQRRSATTKTPVHPEYGEDLLLLFFVPSCLCDEKLFVCLAVLSSPEELNTHSVCREAGLRQW
jgi:hypothetical protein